MLSEQSKKQPYDALSSVSAAWFHSGAICFLLAMAFYLFSLTSIVSKFIWGDWLPQSLLLIVLLLVGEWISLQSWRNMLRKRFREKTYKMNRLELITVVFAFLAYLALAIWFDVIRDKLPPLNMDGFKLADPLQIFMIAMLAALLSFLMSIRVKSGMTFVMTIFAVICACYVLFSYLEDGFHFYEAFICIIYPSIIMFNALAALKRFKKSYPIISKES